MGCSKYKKEKWVIEGTLYQECDLLTPGENQQVHLSFFYRKGSIKRAYYSASTKTDNTGYFRLEYESQKKRAEELQIMGIEVPYRENINLGKFSKQINASVNLQLTNGENLSNKDTVVVFLSECFNSSDYIKIPGPFSSVDLGTYQLVQAGKKLRLKNGKLGIYVPIKYTLYNNEERKHLDLIENTFVTICGDNQQMVISKFTIL